MKQVLENERKIKILFNLHFDISMTDFVDGSSDYNELSIAEQFLLNEMENLASTPLSDNELSSIFHVGGYIVKVIGLRLLCDSCLPFLGCGTYCMSFCRDIESTSFLN